MSLLPATMKAMVLTGHGGFDKLVYHEDWPTPEAGPGEAVIQVAACGMNNTDINTRVGWYSSSVTESTGAGGAGGFDEHQAEQATWGSSAIAFPRIQGADVCGRVVALGEGADPALLGRRVLIDTWLRDWDDPLNRDKCGYYGSECDGGFAAYTKAPVQHIHPIDSPMSDVELASFATSYVTAENMLERAAVTAGDRVLVPGASGGVGTALIQLAKRRGAEVIALSGADKAAAVAALGATVLERSPADLGSALEQATGSATVDVVADVVGGPLWPQFLKVLRRGGRYSCSGAIAGPIVAFDLRDFYLKDLTMTGATIVPPDLFGRLVGYIARGEVKPLVAGTYALRDLHQAQEAFLAKRHVGNLVIDMTAA
ncbi:MAG: alcohol dehydrogenase family protein [Pseudomonadota bacterium]